VLAVGNDGQWQHFCLAAGEKELAADARYLKNSQRVEHRDELVPRVAAIMRRHSNSDWREILTKANVPHAEVREFDQVFRDPQVLERGMKISVRDPGGKVIDLLGSPFRIAGAKLPPPRTPPALGQDTEIILRDLLGIDKNSLEQLRNRGVV
jgi:crotonobetainyl-CoA:carnitine CoA-transferase CaiB-like acyl-CoA transferase